MWICKQYKEAAAILLYHQAWDLQHRKILLTLLIWVECILLRKEKIIQKAVFFFSAKVIEMFKSADKRFLMRRTWLELGKISQIFSTYIVVSECALFLVESLLENESLVRIPDTEITMNIGVARCIEHYRLFIVFLCSTMFQGVYANVSLQDINKRLPKYRARILTTEHWPMGYDQSERKCSIWKQMGMFLYAINPHRKVYRISHYEESDQLSLEQENLKLFLFAGFPMQEKFTRQR